MHSPVFMVAALAVAALLLLLAGIYVAHAGDDGQYDFVRCFALGDGT
jgi:hypothetical protein